MSKMKATAQQLTSFVNNILNVARIDNDQLVLKLHEENWPDILKVAVDMRTLRANVRGIQLELKVADKLPTVGACPDTIQEGLDHPIDHATKNSGPAKEI